MVAIHGVGFIGPLGHGIVKFTRLQLPFWNLLIQIVEMNKFLSAGPKNGFPVFRGLFWILVNSSVRSLTVPFAIILTVISILCEDFIKGWHGHHRFIFIVISPVVSSHPRPFNRTTCKNRGPGRCTHGTCRIGILKVDSLLCQSIQIGCFQYRISCHAQGIITLLIGHNKQKVLLLLCASRNRQQTDGRRNQ